jgi:urea transport system substrate-binding protein
MYSRPRGPYSQGEWRGVYWEFSANHGIMTPMTRLARNGMIGGAIVLASILIWVFFAGATRADAPIRLGLLQSRTGAMMISEKSMIDAETMAVDEINARGGLLGRKVEVAIADGKSDWPTYAKEAERLIKEEKVVTLIGCWTSASRKNVLPVVEKYNHLLIYPMAYEGLEQSPNIIYTGAAPNQQIIPAVKWSIDNLGRKFFLVGSDYVWPHSVNAIVSDQLKALGGEKVGEEYIFFGSSDVANAVAAIRKARPDVIFSEVVGASNIAFYRALREAGIEAGKTPVVSVSIGEDELRALQTGDMVGHYSAWNYFQSLNRKENVEFVRNFQKRYGAARVTSDVIEAAYFSVHLWAQAIRESGHTDVASIRSGLLGQSFDAPEGVISVDPATQHTWRSFSIAKILPNRQFEVVWTSHNPIRPVPYPLSRPKVEWDQFLTDLYGQWGNSWANPVERPSHY